MERSIRGSRQIFRADCRPMQTGKVPNTPEGVVPYRLSIPKFTPPKVRRYNAKHISNNLTQGVSGLSPQRHSSANRRALETSSYAIGREEQHERD
jgi:hypothetical protein